MAKYTWAELRARRLFNDLGLLLAPLTTGENEDGTPYTLAVSVNGGSPLPANAAQEDTQAARYGGGKTAYAGTVSAAGSTTIVTPGAGQRVKVFWVYTLASPDATTAPLITLSLGGTAIYSSYGIAHWEPFLGPVNGALVVDLSIAAAVAVTVHYTLV